MPFKFEKLEVWKLSVEYIDLIYAIAEKLPSAENFNLKSQITRAATSVALNIAEGSNSQTDAEQARFLGLGIRSLVETVACQHLIRRRNFAVQAFELDQAYKHAELLAAKLHSMRKAISPNQAWLREESAEYVISEDPA